MKNINETIINTFANSIIPTGDMVQSFSCGRFWPTNAGSVIVVDVDEFSRHEDGEEIEVGD